MYPLDVIGCMTTHTTVCTNKYINVQHASALWRTQERSDFNERWRILGLRLQRILVHLRQSFVAFIRKFAYTNRHRECIFITRGRDKSKHPKTENENKMILMRLEIVHLVKSFFLSCWSNITVDDPFTHWVNCIPPPTPHTLLPLSSFGLLIHTQIHW